MDPLARIQEALLHDARDRTVILRSDVEKEIAIFADGIDQGVNDGISVEVARVRCLVVVSERECVHAPVGFPLADNSPAVSAISGDELDLTHLMRGG